MNELEKYIISRNATVVDALQKIDKNAQGLVFVASENGRLEGIATDGDIRRYLIRTGDLQGRIETFMNRTPLVTHDTNKEAAIRLMVQKQITALPIVDDRNYLLDIVFLNEKLVDKNSKDSLKGIPVVVMAGGKGTRLYPYTKILPKPLIPIGDAPIMERIIKRFEKYGIDSFFVTVNYRKEMIKAYFSGQEEHYAIRYVEETEPLGTAGSLRLISEPMQKPFFVTNCDILIDADYSELYRHHISSKNTVTIVSSLKNITVPYGVLHTSENGIVQGLEEKPRLSYFVNTGMYILNPEALSYVPDKSFFHMTDLVDSLMKDGKQVGIYPISEDSFLDMGEFEEMHRMEQKLNLKTE